jgi:hypothetical protein
MPKTQEQLLEEISQELRAIRNSGGFGGGGGNYGGGGGGGGYTPPAPSASSGDMYKIPFGEVTDITDKAGEITRRLIDNGLDFGKSITYIFDQITNALIGTFTQSFDMFRKQEAEVSRLFGGMDGFAKTITATINDAIPPARALGFTQEQVLQLQKDVIKTTQTQTLLSSEQYAKLLTSASLVSDSVQGAGAVVTRMMPEFVKAGYSLNNISIEMEGILNKTRMLGVASQATYQQIQENMGRMNLFNFEGGVQGLAKMAANAALIRIDMRETLNVADSLFKPEKAVEMAAGFQRLGVQVSELLDPYSLMDMARNDPERLQESLTKALEQYTVFNEKTQKFELMKGAQGFIRELSEVTGISSKQLAEWSISATELSKKMSEIRFSSDIATEEDRKMIASMAQLGEKGSKIEGKYYVNLVNEQTGIEEQKLVSELSKDDLDKLVKMNEPKSLIDLQKEANGYLQNLKYLRESREGVIQRALAADPNLDKLYRSTTEASTKLTVGINKLVGVVEKNNGLIDASSARLKITDTTRTIYEDIKNSEGFINTAESVVTGIGDIVKDIINGIKEGIPDAYKTGMEYTPPKLEPKDKNPYGNRTTQSVPSVVPNVNSGVPSSSSGPITPQSAQKQETNTNVSGKVSVDVNVNSSNIDPALERWLKEVGYKIIEEKLREKGIIAGDGK